MNKLLKHKNIIVFFLVFILSFGIFADYKKKEAQAFVLETWITTEILYVLGMIVCATGIIALNGEQIVDMGQRVVDRINDNAKLRGQIVFDGAVAVGLKIDSMIKDAAAWVAENLPTSDTDYQKHVFSGFETVVYNKTSYDNRSDVVLEFNHYYDPTFTVTINGLTLRPMQTVSDVDITGNFKLTAFYRITYNDYGYRLYMETVDGRWLNQGTWTSLGYNVGDKVVFGTDTSSSIKIKDGIIPYSNPSIKANYNPTYMDNNLPYTDEKQGYIPIPIEIPDTVVTPEQPLTWDNVKDTVIPLPVDPTEAPSIPDVGEYEIPSDLPVDDTGDITKGGILGGITDFFSWLWELLKALLMGIWNLLKAILDLLLGFVNALLTGLKDLLTYLFVPSDTYFTDVFEDFKNDLFNKLDITSYTMLFDTDYTESSIKDITINIFGKTVTIVRFSVFEEFREIVNTLIYAFMFFLLAIYNYNQIYKLIRGTDYVSASATITHMGGGLTSGEQLKVDSINRRLKKL